MRVTFLANRFKLTSGGGSHRSLDLLATQLTRLGHRVRLVVLNSTGLEAPPGLPYEVVDPGWADCPRLVRIKRTAAILERFAPDTDVFHLYGPQLALGGSVYRHHGGRVPVAVTLNGYTLFCSNMDRMDGRCHRECDLLRRILHSTVPWHKRALVLPGRLYEVAAGFNYSRCIDRWLPVSQPVGDIYAEAGFDMHRSSVISDVIDFDHLVNHWPEARPASESGDRWNILFVGRLIPAKGVDLLIKAMRLLDVPVHLDVAGNGSQREQLEQLVQQLGLRDRVTFHGWVRNDELWRLQQQTHVFVHPGRWPDPCPRAVLEAMAAGLPTVVSRVGGPPWMLDNNGRSFESQDVADLARTLGDALQDYPHSQELALRARERAADFDYRKVTPQLEQVYAALVG